MGEATAIILSSRLLVPAGRLELPRPCGQQVMNLSRLPIPSQGRLEQLLELFDAEARVGHDAAHGVGVDGIAVLKW